MALTDKLSAIGDAIRSKTGNSDLLTLDAMPDAIEGINTGFPNGKEWTKISGLSYMYNMAYANGIYIGVSNGTDGMYYSEDGIKWTKATGIQRVSASHNIVFANNKWYTLDGNSNSLYSSTDGKTWALAINRAMTNNDYLYYKGGNLCGKNIYITITNETVSILESTGDLAYGSTGNNTTFEANGVLFGIDANNKGMCCSYDGTTWTRCTGLPASSNVSNVAPVYGGGIYLTRFDPYDTTLPYSYYSYDGITWNGITGDVTLSIAKGSTVYSDGKWYSACTGGIATSTDGINWTKIYGKSPWCLTYSNGIFLASFVYTDSLYYSYDCISWKNTNMPSNSSKKIYQVHDKLICSASDGVYYSTVWGSD